MSFPRYVWVIAAIFLILPATAPASWIDWQTKDNLAVLKASGVEIEYSLKGVSQPGGLYYPDERPEITLGVPVSPTKGIDGASLELLGVHNMSAAPGEVGFVLVTVAPKIQLKAMAPARVKLDDFKPSPAGNSLRVTVPLPKPYGAYVIILERKDGSRTLVGSVARVHRPVESKGEIPQIMLESGVSDWSRLGPDSGNGPEALASAYERMGVRLLRWEFHWQQDGPAKPYHWDWIDDGLNACSRHGIRVMNTMGADPWWTMPLGGNGPVPCVLHTINTVAMPKYDADYGKWVHALVERHWKGGKSGLWAIEHWNEPWEPGSCAGWDSDSVRYRQLLEVLSREAHAAAPGIRIAAACSVMNTEDKLTSDGSADRMKWIDLMTDHYVVPCNAYGPRVAAKYGKISGETETWGVASEVLLPQFMTQFLAVGNTWLNPMTGDMPFQEMGSKGNPLLNPRPLAATVSAWNAFVADRPFKRIVFTDHLPWLYQFGNDDDAALVLYGKAMPLASGNVRDVVWRQAAEGPEGRIEIADPDGALVITDMEGNAVEPSTAKLYDLPMSHTAFFMKSPQGAAYAIDCIRKAPLRGLRQVEILPGTLMELPSAGKPAKLIVSLHNLRNATLNGQLIVESLLKDTPLSVKISKEILAGQTLDVVVDVTSLPTAGLPLAFSFVTAEDTDRWQEVIRPTAIVRATLPVDATEQEWEKSSAPKVTVLRPVHSDGTENVIERAWLPFIEHRDISAMPARRGEVRLAWDERSLYILASIDSEKPSPRDHFDHWNRPIFLQRADGCDLRDASPVREISAIPPRRPR